MQIDFTLLLHFIEVVMNLKSVYLGIEVIYKISNIFEMHLKIYILNKKYKIYFLKC